MKKKTDDEILSHCQRLEEDASSYTWGQLGTEREKAMREYYREPYGTEEDGHSSIVTSEVQDTVEWILPSMLKIFTSTDKAVSFEPTKASEEQAAEQATATCNYVFYKQNNGFLTLYTAIKDGLLVKNGVVTWSKHTRRTKRGKNARGADEMVIAALVAEGWEIESAETLPPQLMVDQAGNPLIDPMTGAPAMQPATYNVRLCRYEEKKTIKVEAIPPERLLVQRDWASPLLEECPYVCHVMPVTLSDLHEMGFTDVEADDLSNSDETRLSPDASYRENRSNTAETGYIGETTSPTDDETLTTGILYREWVLIDADGDGIAERLEVLRLEDKILSKEECTHVPVAMFSPILNTHRFDGMSVAELMSDLQRLKTELTRQMMDSAYLANNARTVVVSGGNMDTPQANIDDLLDSRPGGIIRVRSLDSIRQDVIPFVGQQTLPLLQYVDSMGEKRTGVSLAQQGLDPNSLRNDKTATEAIQTANAAQARVELIARVFAETGMVPMFNGILKLLTDGEMEPIAFKLLGEYVEFDPNEWDDGYNMTVNVGLGTGDRNQQVGNLTSINQIQMGLLGTPLGPLLVDPDKVYNTLAKQVEAIGYKNVGDFFIDPQGKQVPPPQAPPDPAIQIAQMKQQGDAMKMQAETKRDLEKAQLDAAANLQAKQSELELQAANDRRDGEREMMKLQADHQLEIEKLALDRYKVDQDNATRIQVALIQANEKRESAMLSAETAMRNADVSAESKEAEPPAEEVTV